MRNKGVHAKLSRRATVQAMEEDASKIQKERREQPAQSAPVSRKSPTTWKGKVLSFYETHYMKMILIPVLVLLLSMGQIAYQYSSTGEIFAKDVSLSGGTSLTIHRDGLDVTSLEAALANSFGLGQISVRSLRQAGDTIGVIIEASPEISEQQLLSTLETQLGTLQQAEYSLEITGSSLGQSFFAQLFRAFLVAFVLMAVVVLIYFRSWAPAAAVLLAVFSDILGTIAVMNVMGVRFSGAGIAALLMLIGYAVSSNMLLSTRMLKRKDETLYESIFSTLKPGLMMTMATFISVTLALLYTESDVIRQIMLILFVGLLFDMFNTWVQNAGILIYYEKRKGGAN